MDITYYLVLVIRDTDKYHILENKTLEDIDFYISNSFLNENELIEYYREEINYFFKNEKSSIPSSAFKPKYKNLFYFQIVSLYNDKIVQRKRILYREDKMYFKYKISDTNFLKQMLEYVAQDNTINEYDSLNQPIKKWINESIKNKKFYHNMRLFLNVAYKLEKETINKEKSKQKRQIMSNNVI